MEAIGSKNRLKILKQLTIRDKYFSELMKQLNIDGKNLKHHLQKLEQENIISSYKEERRRYYSLEKEIRLEITPPPEGKFLLLKSGQ